MDLRQIQYFVALYEEKSITKAARRLHVVQPAVSMQIRRLEADYGVKLFDRTPHGVNPNAHARALYPLCRETLLNAERLRTMLRESSDQLAGELVVGVPPSLALGSLGRTLAEFHDQNPGLQLRVHEGYSANLLDWLIQGELDFAFVNFVDGERRLSYRHLATEELVVVIGHDTPWSGETISGTDLASFKMIAASPRNSLRMIIEAHFAQVGIELNGAIEVNSLVAICNMVQRPNWASILPRSAVPSGGIPAAPRVLRLVDPKITRSLTVAHQPQHEPSAAGELFIEFVSRSLRDQLAGGAEG